MSVAKLQCGRCGFCYEVSHDTVRAANESDTKVPCPRCELRKAKRSAPKPATAADAVLLAAMKLMNAEGAAVFRTALVAATWSATKERFGMEGDRERFPDSKRVDAEIVRLVRKGWLRKVKPNHWTVTDAGCARVKALR
jgi:hypothetical protein